MPNAKKPNVLFILTDDQRFDTIHALGNKKIQTPNLDRLCREGMAFTNAHIPSGTVGAVCMPSRAMLNTGRTLFHLCENGAEIPTDHKTMPETFRANGYQTYGTGKWHNGSQSYARSFTAGDEIFFGGMWDHWNVPTYDFDPTGKYEQTSRACMGAFYTKQTVVNRANHVNLGVHSTDLFAQKALDYLDAYDFEDPFYMYVAFMAPHDPRTMPEQFQNMYKAEDMELPPNFAGLHFDFGVYQCRDEKLEAYPRDPVKVRQHIADYYAMISHLDWRIGQLIEKLKKKGQYENTIIVFAGDNGLSVGQHGLMGKQNGYEHSIRVPLILCGPGIPKNKTSDSYVYLLDIFPTLCHLTGVECPDSVEGIDFSPILRDPEARTRDTLYAAYADKIRTVKDLRYKLIEYRFLDIDGKTVHKYSQLFDLQADPWEACNLIHSPELQDKVAELRSTLLQYRDAWDEMDHPIAKNFWKYY